MNYKKRGVIIILILSLLVTTVIASEHIDNIINTNGRNNHHNLHNEDDSNETNDTNSRFCTKECNMQFIHSLHQCNGNFRNSIQECNEIRKEAIMQCEGLRGDEKRDCVRIVNNATRQCKNSALQIKNQCKENARSERKECVMACRQLEDSDNDGVKNERDNCQNIFNPEQEDSNRNRIGDVCEEFQCCIDRECFQATIEQCISQGGAVMECKLPERKIGRDIQPTERKNFTLTTFNTSDPLLVNLTNAVISTGVNNTNYSLGNYDCRNFAESLEKNLTSLGYNATWTAYWCYGGIGNPPPTAHAVTDVHLPDGRTVFIEPQNNRIVNLDFDGDGVVEVNNNGYTPGQNTGQTDDNCKISVFENRAAARASGVPGA